jgi:hypothetical protein
MTVCIAALCQDDDSKPAIIYAADTELSRRFTHSLIHLKREYLAGKWNALLAADDLAHVEALLDEAKVQLPKIDIGKYAQVLSALRAAREAVLVRLAGDASLPPGFSLNDYYQDGRRILSESAYQDVWGRLAKFKLGCDLLVFGFDDSGHAHLAVVGDEAPTSYDRVGFHAIGSGWVNAIGILSANDPSPLEGWRTCRWGGHTNAAVESN